VRKGKGLSHLESIQILTTLYPTKNNTFVLHVHYWDRFSPAELLTQFIAAMDNYTTAV
jgi:hypothetical protein